MVTRQQLIEAGLIIDWNTLEWRGRIQKAADQKWDLDRFDEEVRRSQARRWVVYDVLRNGQYFPWDYQPLKQASERFMRNHMDLNEVEHNQMFPRNK